MKQRIFFALTALLVASAAYLVVTYIQVSRAATEASTASPEGDVVLVLGAAQYNGDPSPVFESRLVEALEAYESGPAETIITTGANQPGDTFTEGFAGFTWLRNAGVPESDIVVVVDGANTYESLLAAARFVPDGDIRVILVTDGYHALRARHIAEEVGLDVGVASPPTPSRFRSRVRETVAIAIGRVISFRRLSAVTT